MRDYKMIVDKFKKIKIPIILRAKFNFYFILLHIFKKSSFLANGKRNTLIEINKKTSLKKFDNSPKEVERRKNLSEKEFLKYLKAGVPVIFDKEALDWPATKKWNFDFFEQHYGDEKFPIVSKKGLDEKYQDPSLPKDGEMISIKELVKSWRNKENNYLRFCKIMEFFPELQKDFNLKWLEKMRQCFIGFSYQSFIGPAKRITTWHCGMTAFFFVTVTGTKDWEMYPADLSPLMNVGHDGFGYYFSDKDEDEISELIKEIKPYKCTLEPGDILFIPAWMWHRVENQTDTIGVSYRFANIRGILRFPVLTTIRFFFTNPSFLTVIKNSFKKKSDHENALTPKLYVK